MASDWIKIEHALPNKPEVMQLAEILNIDQMQVIGHLVCFWCWCDQNLSRECPQVIGTKKGLDRVSGRDGFADALVVVGWLSFVDGHVVIPNYDHHLSQSAKQRALEAKKKKNQRAKSPAHSPENVPARTGQNRGLEKRREENKEEEVPNGTSCSEPENQASEPETEQKPPANKSTRVNEVSEVVVISYPVFPCNGNPKHWTLTPEKIQEYQQAFPGVDCQAEARKAWQWCQDNPTRRKTVKGMGKFLFGWLERVQNRTGGNNGTASNGTHKPPPQQFKNSTGQQQDHMAEVLRKHLERKQNEQRHESTEQQARPAIDGRSTGYQSICDDPD